MLIKSLCILAILVASVCADAQQCKAERAVSTKDIIAVYAHKHSLDYNLVYAIFMQESSLRVNAYNKSDDYGIGQINIQHIKRLKLNKHRLLTDVHYSIEQSMLILKELKQKYSKRDVMWWTRYHSFRPTHRTKYAKLVQRHMLATIPLNIAQMSTKPQIAKRSPK